jgi:carbon monoxide dehydrogenase subunit G
MVVRKDRTIGEESQMSEPIDLLDQATAALTTAPIQFDLATRVNAPHETVFDFVADHEQLPTWVPGVKRVEVDNTNAALPGRVGAVRVMHPGPGGGLRETVRAFDRPWMYAYSAKSLFGMLTDHTAIFVFEPDGDSTLVRWRTCAVPGSNPIMRFVGRRVFPFQMNWIMRNLQKHFSQ